MYDFTERPERTEARAIIRLVSLGTTTLEDARELISIPERQEQALRTFVAIAGKDGAAVRSALAFRHRVMTEFEQLVTSGNSNVASSHAHETNGLKRSRDVSD
jgi:hypothetical protein